MFAVGFGEVSDTTELDASSSLPTDDYEMIIRSENEMGELPGLMIYQLKNGNYSLPFFSGIWFTAYLRLRKNIIKSYKCITK